MANTGTILRQPPGLISAEGIAFIGAGDRGSSSGNHAHIQLFNPSTSNVKLIVTKMFARAGGLTFVRIGGNTAALTTLETLFGSKLLGGAAPVAEIRNQINTSMLGTQISKVIYNSGTNSIQMLQGEPIVVMPGNGLLLIAQTQNVGLSGQFEWIETPV